MLLASCLAFSGLLWLHGGSPARLLYRAAIELHVLGCYARACWQSCSGLLARWPEYRQNAARELGKNH